MDVHNKISLPRSIHEVFLDSCVRIFGPSNVLHAEECRRNAEGKKSKAYVCTTQIPLPDPPGVIPRRSSNLAQSVVDALEQDDLDEAEEAKARQKELDAAHTTMEQRQH